MSETDAMTSPRESTPILPKPFRLRGTGAVRLCGAGQLAFDLFGEGQVVICLRRRAQVAFEGVGNRRDPGPDCMVLYGARGTLTVSGPDLDVEFRGGLVGVLAAGTFEVALDGRGEIETPQGDRTGWGLFPRTMHLGDPRPGQRAA